MNPNPCKVCHHPNTDEIDKLIRARTSYATIVKSFPDLSTKGISRHKINHLNISEGPKPPEVAPEELDNLPVPDVVKIVERQVSDDELIKRQRQLTPHAE